LNGSLKEDFERDGFVVFDSGVSTAVLGGVVAELEDDFVPAAERPFAKEARDRLRRRVPYPYTDHIRIQDAWRRSSKVHSIARAPTILGVLRELYGREPLPFQTLNFRLGTQQAPHADAFHFNSDPPGFMCGVWVALEDIDETSGPLVYYPGSHRLPETRTSDVPMAPGEEEYAKYEQYVGEQIEREGLKPHIGTLEKGQALVWASNLLHGGSPRKDPERTRRSQVTHYFFEGCSYWTPMMSGGDHVETRAPVFIS
jgi:ectoine hydroxylase-related dioxygenase (phytanoyl-CoA dioxygenase family)